MTPEERDAAIEDYRSAAPWWPDDLEWQETFMDQPANWWEVDLMKVPDAAARFMLIGSMAEWLAMASPIYAHTVTVAAPTGNRKHWMIDRHEDDTLYLALREACRSVGRVMKLEGEQRK
jgi:hypothetical protein